MGEPRAKKTQMFTQSEMKELLQIFKHLKSKNEQNNALDHFIFNSYNEMSHSLNDDESKQNEQMQRVQSIVDISNKTMIPCNVFVSQLVQTKAQIKAMRLLSRDLNVSESLSQIAHGMDNSHSWQRPFIDPTRQQNPSTIGASKYNLRGIRQQNAQCDEIFIDSTPQTVEELVFQKEFDAKKKIVQRRRMLKDYIVRCEAAQKAKKQSFDKATYQKSKQEFEMLQLYELQCKVRNEVLHSRLDRAIYDEDNADNEALIEPDLFARTAKIGLHFDPHINTANHPPAMATSDSIFPYYYVGQR